MPQSEKEKAMRSKLMKEMNQKIREMKAGEGSESKKRKSSTKKTTSTKKKKSQAQEENLNSKKQISIKTQVDGVRSVSITQNSRTPTWNKEAVARWCSASLYRTVAEGPRPGGDDDGPEAEISDGANRLDFEHRIRKDPCSSSVPNKGSPYYSRPVGSSGTNSARSSHSDRDGGSVDGSISRMGRKGNRRVRESSPSARSDTIDEEDASRVVFMSRRRRRRHRRVTSHLPALSVGSHTLSEIGQYNPAYVNYRFVNPFEDLASQTEILTFELTKNPFASLDYINTLYYNRGLMKAVKVPRIELLKYKLTMPPIIKEWMPDSALFPDTDMTINNLYFSAGGWGGTLYFHNLTSPQSSMDLPFPAADVASEFWPPACCTPSAPGMTKPALKADVVNVGTLSGKWVQGGFKDSDAFKMAYREKNTSTLDTFQFNSIDYWGSARQRSTTSTNPVGQAPLNRFQFQAQSTFENDEREVDFTDGSGRGIMLGSNRIHLNLRSSDHTLTEKWRGRDFWMNVYFWIRIHWENLDEQMVIDAWNSQNATATGTEPEIIQ